MWVRDPRNDFVNIAGATTGKVIEIRGGGRRVELKDVRGNPIAVVPEDALAPPETVIAGPLAAAFIAPDGSVQWRAVAAWRVGRDGAEAIIAGTRPVGAMHIEFADGSLLGVDCGRRYPDLKAATKSVRDAAAERESVQ